MSEARIATGAGTNPPVRIRSDGTRLIAVPLALLLLLLVGVSGRGWLARRATAPTQTLAVLPFENLGHDPARDYLADGLTEETERVTGPDRSGSPAGERPHLDHSVQGTTKPIAQIGRELGADYLLESSLQAEGERLRITSTLIRVRDEVQVWSASFDREPTSLLGVQQELSRALAEQIRVSSVSGTTRDHRRAAIQKCGSLRSDLRGRSLWNQFTPPTTREAIQDFQRATVLDPGYGLAWAGIADAYSGGTINGDAEPLRVLPLAREAVTRAMQSASGLSEVQASLGFTNLCAGLRTRRPQKRRCERRSRSTPTIRSAIACSA